MGKFYNEHPVLTFVLLFVLVIVCIWVKMSIDEKKGENSAEKQKIHEILRQKVSCYGQYIPVYAYQRETYGRKSVKSWHYALGITAEQLYIRESRHIIGEYQLTIDDVLENRDQWDKIAIVAYIGFLKVIGGVIPKTRSLMTPPPHATKSPKMEIPRMSIFFFIF